MVDESTQFGCIGQPSGGGGEREEELKTFPLRLFLV